MEDDEYFGNIALKNKAETTRFYTHEEAWKKENRKRSYGRISVAFLLGVAFVLMGVWTMCFDLLKPLAILERAQTWVATSANISSLTLEYEGDLGWSMTMCYQYDFNGQTHISKRVTLLNGLACSRYNRDNYFFYKPLFDAKTPINCWVDPNNPDEAVVDRTLRFPSLAGLIFIAFVVPLIGLICLYSGFRMCNVDILRPALISYTVFTFASTVFLFSRLIFFFPWPWYIYLSILPATLLLYHFAYPNALRNAINVKWVSQ
ncbi:MAG: DUF3592 domain-containing protein [Kiritimatiellaeota bacterium]|nr:DUF3592 domain-containing protein [Kiritimatiellota bacterium]